MYSYYNENTIIYVDGEYVKASEAKIDLYGQSLHYGYAVFEGIRAYKTAAGEVKIFKAEEHFDRFRRSCELIHMPYNYSNEELIAACYKVLELNNMEEAYIRPLAYCPPNMTLKAASEMNVMICAWEWGAYLGEKLLKVMTSSYQRPNPKAFKIESKSAGLYINSILASQEAKSLGYDEALLLDLEGYVAEGPGANIFFEKDGKIVTPPPGAILPGITRATVIELCQELNIPLEQRLFTTEELKTADCAFFCGTAAEVIGIESLDGQTFAKPWATSLGKLLQQAYKARVLEKEFDRSSVKVA
ncbi:branched-chain amino acid transaminase [Chitinophaga sancti]|uniref:Branched-chain-amino-acid aminotransferase n=1 Tax=Chitinophaga sancti TaxID=1004 RepID=A0A1K1PUR8_9BACT|nr:branched-chain amino acid transaminase [Chitinophaga sancti]WQD61618.1 branched-chain amino acid transaminase [Chitinophaga sancti]WQG92825.1 branched-chain amino acid transaminase [Chitinophaga sancti]SFW51252.1 branched-chain amino acid aminotransferase [Chitinophaga sancti]